MAVFEMRNARKAFGALEVLKGVSLKVEKGEVVSIIGPSGGGKSTMLRCATLLETMDSGTLAYGENVAAREENGKSVYAGKAALAQVRAHNDGITLPTSSRIARHPYDFQPRWQALAAMPAMSRWRRRIGRMASPSSRRPALRFCSSQHP